MSFEARSNRYYQSVEEVEAVVRRFESCELSLSEFNHRAHLTVAFWYLTRLSVAEATEQMRTGLYRFINHYGGQGYNETITLFWIKLIRHFLDNTSTAIPVVDLMNEVIERCSNPHLIFHHYTKERLSSEEAKTTWVEPDLKPLDF